MHELTEKVLKTLDAARANIDLIRARLPLDQRDFSIPNPDFRQPAVDFERKYGLHGISGKYKLPEGLASADLESYVLLIYGLLGISQELQHAALTNVWKTLMQMNPELEGICGNASSTKRLFHAVMGVASAFNPDDIRHFAAETGPRAQKMCESQPYKGLLAVFNSVSSKRLELGWVASPRTLALIQKQFEDAIEEAMNTNIQPAAAPSAQDLPAVRRRKPPAPLAHAHGAKHS